MKSILVVYLISVYDKREYLTNFINHYTNFTPGKEHDLLICFKKILLLPIIWSEGITSKIFSGSPRKAAKAKAGAVFFASLKEVKYDTSKKQYSYHKR